MTSTSLTYDGNDSAEIPDDCKKASNLADGAARKIKSHLAGIGSRLNENNREIAQILSVQTNSASDARISGS
jgi:hypothetical protein